MHAYSVENPIQFIGSYSQVSIFKISSPVQSACCLILFSFPSIPFHVQRIRVCSGETSIPWSLSEDLKFFLNLPVENLHGQRRFSIADTLTHCMWRASGKAGLVCLSMCPPEKAFIPLSAASISCLLYLYLLPVHLLSTTCFCYCIFPPLPIFFGGKSIAFFQINTIVAFCVYL